MKKDDIEEKDNEVDISSTSSTSINAGDNVTRSIEPVVAYRPNLEISEIIYTRPENVTEISSGASVFSAKPMQASTSQHHETRKTFVKDILNEMIELSYEESLQNYASTSARNHSEAISEPDLGRAPREYEVYRSLGDGVINSTSAIHDEQYLERSASGKSVRVPPSYSTVLKLYRPLPYARSQIDSYPSVPFIVRQPPPSYSEVQGEFEESHSIISAESFLFGPDPIYLICPRCRVMVYTEVRTERSTLSHIASAILCMCLCWPCCWIPYCLKSCMYTYHTCPNCQHYFGMYEPW